MPKVRRTNTCAWIEGTPHDMTNMGGLPTNRVRGRRRRAIRWKNDENGNPTIPVGMDVLKVGEDADGNPHYVDNTGTFGFRTSYGTYLSMLERTPGINGKVRARQGGKGRGAKRVNRYRNPGASCSPKLSTSETWHMKVEAISYARNLLMKARTIENISDGKIKLLNRWQNEALDSLVRWCHSSLSVIKLKEIDQKDAQRFRSLAGEYQAGHMRSKGLIKLGKEIKRAIFLVGTR